MNNSPYEINENISIISDDELSRAVEERGEEMKNAAPAKRSCEGHRGRVRERFLKSGLDGFAPHEILELLLFYAIPRQDTKKMAHELIDRFGSVSGVFDADVSELTQVKGVTENAAVLFRLIPKILSVYYTEQSKGVSYTNTDMLASLFRPCFVGEATEKFLIACFDSSLRLLGITEISRGTSAYAAVEMRKIMSAVLNKECAMAAVAHNHPNGSPKPSDEDIAVTRRINELLAAVDVRLMDHIIIGRSMTYSMRDGGDLSIFD